MRDRRFNFRQELDNHVKLQWVEPAGTLSQCTGTLCDLSVSGMRVTLERPIVLQTQVGLTIDGKELRGTVRYCTRTRTRYMVGLELGMESQGVLKPSL